MSYPFSPRKIIARTAHWAMEKAKGPGTWLKSAGQYNIPHHYPWNWWQKDMPLGAAEYERFAPVYACVAIIAQDISRIPLMQIRTVDKIREQVTTTAAARLFRKPNSYQSRSDFVLYMMRSLLLDGNAYAIVGGRNDRNEITSLYPLSPKSIWPHIEPGSGEYFYRIGQDATTELAAWDPNVAWLPPEDVLHIRLMTPKHPLIGESPLVAAMYPTIAGTQINAHNAAFFSNMSRPSGVLRHPGRLKPEAMSRIKQRWMELTGGSHTGEPAVLAEGMEWQQLQMNAVDAELAASYKMSERQIFQIYRVPSFLGGDLQDGATFSNVESLTRFYLQSCLGFYVDHIEEALTLFFGLSPSDGIIFDVESALLRGDLKERMEALGVGVRGGVLAIDEARSREGLPPVEYGDKPRVQQQMVPLEYGVTLQPPSNESSPVPAANDESKEEESDTISEEDKALYLERSAKSYLLDIKGAA